MCAGENLESSNPQVNAMLGLSQPFNSIAMLHCVWHKTIRE